jgi:hypothetical protein
MDPTELTGIYENQAAKMLLNKEASLISDLAHEGMMTPHDCEIELKRINVDLNNIEKLRKAHSKYASLPSLLTSSHQSILVSGNSSPSTIEEAPRNTGKRMGGEWWNNLKLQKYKENFSLSP